MFNLCHKGFIRESYGRLITVSKGLRFMQELRDGYKLVTGEGCLYCRENRVGVVKHAVLLIHDLGIKSNSMYGMLVVKPAWDTQTTCNRRVINALHKMSSETLHLNFCRGRLRGQACASIKWQAEVLL